MTNRHNHHRQPDDKVLEELYFRDNNIARVVAVRVLERAKIEGTHVLDYRECEDSGEAKQREDTTNRYMSNRSQK